MVRPRRRWPSRRRRAAPCPAPRGMLRKRANAARASCRLSGLMTHHPLTAAASAAPRVLSPRNDEGRSPSRGVVAEDDDDAAIRVGEHVGEPYLRCRGRSRRRRAPACASIAEASMPARAGVRRTASSAPRPWHPGASHVGLAGTSSPQANSAAPTGSSVEPVEMATISPGGVRHDRVARVGPREEVGSGRQPYAPATADRTTSPCPARGGGTGGSSCSRRTPTLKTSNAAERAVTDGGTGHPDGDRCLFAAPGQSTNTTRERGGRVRRGSGPDLTGVPSTPWPGQPSNCVAGLVAPPGSGSTSPTRSRTAPVGAKCRGGGANRTGLGAEAPAGGRGGRGVRRAAGGPPALPSSTARHGGTCHAAASARAPWRRARVCAAGLP